MGAGQSSALVDNEKFGIKFSPLIYNASGAWCMSESELHDLGKSRAGAILIKSTTLEPRDGNLKPRWFEDKLGSVNSMGLPNLGPEKYASIIPDLRQYNKPIIASVSGMKPDDYVPITQRYLQAGVDALEINLSCPNIVGKPQVAFDFETSKDVLVKVKKVSGSTPIGVKLPPYPDPIFAQKMVDVLKEVGVDYVVMINSVPHACIIDPITEEFVIKNKFGGLGGMYVKPVAIGQVRRMYELFDEKQCIVGCGGVETGMDIVEHLLAGASLVQIGTQLMKEGPKVFERLENEFKAALDKKGVKDAKELIGRAKPRESQIPGMLNY
eukprot:tig00001049_g6677.t1